MSSEAIQAIDVHGHYGTYRHADDLTNAFMSADGDEVVRRARLANTRLTIVSPMEAISPRLGGDPLAANEEAARIVGETEGLLQWVVVDPTRPPTFEQAADMLKLPKCVGVKIHPEEHGYPITEHGRAALEFAAEHHAIIQSHSGEENSLPADFVTLADDFPDVVMILSHLGHGFDEDLSHQVRAIRASKHGNLYTDTSSAKSITPNLIEWAVEQIDAEHILYGTDTPVYFAPMQRARIDHAGISDEDKRLILRGNAIRLFGLKEGDS